MKVVILAGGMGTRLSEETEYRPKPMIEIGGMPILWHIMKEYSYYGFNEFIICAGYKQQIIKEWFRNYFLFTSDITFDLTEEYKMTVHDKHTEPWKVTVVDTGLHTMTGGRIKRVQKYIGNEPFMMTYGDGVCDVNIDELAAVLQGDSGDLCGHAGLFSTMPDMIRFCRAVLAGKIVSGESLREIAVNRTGRKRPDGTHTQYLGLQCYVRHPEQYHSEIPVYMGRNAFGIGGFTGNHVSVDPLRGLFTIFLGNRVKNRLTVLIPEAGKDLTDYGLNADGSGFFRWTDGEVIPSSVKYVHQKDAHLHRAVAETLGLPEIPFTEEE